MKLIVPQINFTKSQQCNIDIFKYDHARVLLFVVLKSGNNFCRRKGCIGAFCVNQLRNYRLHCSVALINGQSQYVEGRLGFIICLQRQHVGMRLNDAIVR